MNRRVLIPLPSKDFDPTETAVPFTILKEAGVNITFSTPDGKPAQCDERMAFGFGLGPLKNLLAATDEARVAYANMIGSEAFKNPIKWQDINPLDFDGLLLPGGHAKGMIEYLESPLLQKNVSDFFELNKTIGAICHGVVLAARSKNKSGQSVLHGRKTTCLLASQEISAWLMTFLWLGNYYRTYAQTVEYEVKSVLKTPDDFKCGPMPLIRDSRQNLNYGFVVEDGNYISARWPGDAHKFAIKFLEHLNKYKL